MLLLLLLDFLTFLLGHPSGWTLEVRLIIKYFCSSGKFSIKSQQSLLLDPGFVLGVAVSVANNTEREKNGKVDSEKETNDKSTEPIVWAGDSKRATNSPPIQLDFFQKK